MTQKRNFLISLAVHMICFILGSLLLDSKDLYAGGWNSNGGELLEDSQNPWFIHPLHAAKKMTINYCIVHDADYFHAPLSDIQRHVRNAFQYWWDEFSSAEYPENLGLGKVLVATENFIEISCDADGRNPNVRIKFQFGKLFPDQIEEFKKHGKDPKRLTAVAIRETYDEVHLEGRGFIYIAADSGPLKIEGESVVENPWTANNQNRLAMILRHEVGHVFGVPHIGERTELMGAGFPEFMVQKDVQDVAWKLPARIFRKPWGNTTTRYCQTLGRLNQNLRDFYGVPAQYNCISYQFFDNRFELYGSESDQGFPDKIGVATYEQKESKKHSIVRLWLPKAQNVFPNIPAALMNMVNVADSMHYRISGTYKSQIPGPELTRKFVLSINPSEFTIDGMFEESGRLMLDLHRDGSRGFR